LQSIKNALFKPDGREDGRLKEIPFTAFGVAILGTTCLVTFPTVAVVVVARENCEYDDEPEKNMPSSWKLVRCTYHLETWRNP
jgi:hypothetical protein